MAGRVVADLELESVTPLWPGGPLEGRTYYCRGSNCVGPFLPDSKQLIGRLRWMLRALEASVHLLRGKPIRRLQEVDTLASRILGSTSSASKLVVRLNYSYDPRQIDYMDPRKINRGPPDVEHFIETAEIKGYLLLRGRLGLKSEPILKPDSTVLGRFIANEEWLNSNIGVIGDLCRLLTIPRIRLALQDISASRFFFYEIYSRLPLRPALSLRVKVLRRIGTRVSDVEAELVKTLVPYTLYFMGLGKATSRGFGRFHLTSWGEGGDNECLEMLKRLEPNAMDETFTYCGCRLIELAASALGFEGLECEKDVLQEYRLELEVDDEIRVTNVKEALAGLGVPSLLVALANSRFIGRLKHPCPYATSELTQLPSGCNTRPVGDIIDALSAVGKATLKSTWKMLQGSPTQPGPGYHTWALGLPRHVGRPPFDKLTGYILGPAAFREDCGPSPRRIVGAGLHELRRPSPLVITSACKDGSCSALLQPFITIQDFRENLPQLLHVGQHRRHIYHVAGVEYIASSRQLGQHRRCSRVRDRGGVAVPGHPPGQATAHSNVELVAQLAALDWIESLLS